MAALQMEPERKTADPGLQQQPPEAEPATGLKGSLRGMDYAAQAQALAPVQLKPAAGAAQVQREASDNPYDDDVYFDPKEHGAAMGPTPETADPKTAATSLRPGMEQRRDGQQESYDALASMRNDIDKSLQSASGDEKKRLEAKKVEIEAALGQVEGKLLQTKKDLKSLDDPATSPSEFNKIVARQQSKGETTGTTTADTSKPMGAKTWDDVKGREGVGGKLGGAAEYVDGRLNKEKTTTKTSYADGEAKTETESQSSKLGLGGATRSNGTSSESLKSDGSSSSSSSSQTTSFGKDGFKHETSDSSSETDKDGKKSSTSSTKSTQIGSKGASTSATDKTTNADGTATSTTKTRGIERGDGKLGVAGGSSTTKTDAEGSDRTLGGTAKGGMIAGKDGLGAFGDVEGKYDKHNKNGLKTGAVGGLDAKVVCNVVEIPGKTPKQYAITLSVNLGAKLGLSAGYDKKVAPGEEAGPVKGGASVSGSTSISMNVRKVLSEAEAKAYIDGLKVANAGGGGSQKEFAIISTGVNGSWEAAQKMYTGYKAKAGDPAAANALKEGEKVEVTEEDKLGGDANLGGNAGGVSAGVSGGYEVGVTEKFSVERKDGKLVYTKGRGDSEKLSGGVTGGMGIVSGGVSGSQKSSSGTEYTFSLDPKNKKDFANMQRELAAAKTQEQLDAFAKKYPEAVGSKKVSKGTATESKTNVGVAGVGVAISSGASYDESTTTDKDGNVTGQQMEGTNSGGAELSLGGYKIGASSKEGAKVSVNEKGEAAVDISQADSSTDAAKFLEAHVPFAGDDTPDKDGALTKAAGGSKPKDTDTKNISGMAMNGSDLESMAALAKNKGAWMGACSSPRLRGDWAKARIEVLNAGGSQAAVGKALARFMGKSGHGRDDIIMRAMRDPGDVSGGKRYEFPDGLGHLKAKYDALVVGNPLPQIKAAGAKGPAAAQEKAESLVSQLSSLYSAVASAEYKFHNKATWGEMIAAISTRKSKVEDELRILGGGKAGELSKDDLRNKYNEHLGNCRRFKDTETGVFAQIADAHADGHTSLDETIANAKLIKQLRDLYATWEPQYAAMANLAQVHGFGKGIYYQFKPDRPRFNRSLGGAPGPASPIKPETEDYRPKKEEVRASKDPIGDSMKKLEKKRQESAAGIQGQVPAARNKAYGAGNKLHAWIQKRRIAASISAHNDGMVQLRSGNSYLKKCQAGGTMQDWNAYGYAAITDYNNAYQCFKDGLVHYPPGWPPKS